ncbi:hypothetical protein BH23BAC3_BH23BAC3_18500 [soil metagenome]
MFNLTFDHYTIKVKNLETSVDFYRSILGLSEIENRTRKEYIRWFSLGEHRELHVVEREVDDIVTNIGVHLALKLSDLDPFLEHLKLNRILAHNSKGTPGSISTRADGVRQVYFQDPDGYWIEVNESADIRS